MTPIDEPGSLAKQSPQGKPDSRPLGWGRRFAFFIGKLALLFLLANGLYAAKSLLGIDIDGSAHHGNLFPIGQAVYRWLSAAGPFRSFDGPCVAETSPSGQPGHASGQIARGWYDNSTWGPATVKYSCVPPQSPNEPTAQRIELVQVRPGGACQLAQSVAVRPFRRYRATMEVRAASRTVVSLRLRCHGAPYRTVAVTNTVVGPYWQTVEVTGVFRPENIVNGAGIVMVGFNTPGVIQVRRATFEDMGGRRSGE